MSLEELRQQVEESDATEVVETEENLDLEESETEETEEETESKDFELELEGEAPQPTKPTAEEALIHKLSRQKKRAKEAESEAEELRKRLEALEARQSQPVQPAPTSHAGEPTFPDLYDKNIDGDRAKYDQAVKQWYRDMANFQSRQSGADAEQEEYKARIRSMTEQIAKNAAKFATENKVSIDRVGDALEQTTTAIDSATGIDGAAAYLLDSVGEGAERVGFYLGTNETARSEVLRLLKEDPNGLKAISYMARLATKLKPKPGKQISKAPEPDEPVTGDAVGTASQKKLQEMWDKEEDPNKLQAIRRKARELGVELKT